MTIDVEYFCPDCNVNFHVFHQTDQRNEFCAYCNNKVKLTGIISKLENDYIVTYKDNQEISRELLKALNIKLT